MVGHIYYPDESRLRREAEALIQEGYEVSVLALRRPSETATDEVNGVRIYRVPLARKRGGKIRYTFEFGLFFVFAALLTPLLQARHRFAVVQLYNQPDFLIFALLLPRLMGAMIVLDYRDAMPESFVCKYGWSMKHPLIRLLLWFERAALVLADRVVTVHEPFRQQAIARGARPENVCSFLNFPDPHLFDRSRVPPQPRDPAVSLHLMYHGTIADRFGLATALEAVSHLRGEIPGVRFTIYGDGDGVAELKRLISEFNLNGTAVYGGRLSLNDVPTYVSTADMGIVPVRRSLAADLQLSTRIMEYMIMGKPVIASRRPILEEYFDPASIVYFEDGDVSDLAAQIIHLWGDPPRRAQVVAAADAFLRRYPWEGLKREYLDMFRELCARRVA